MLAGKSRVESERHDSRRRSASLLQRLGQQDRVLVFSLLAFWMAALAIHRFYLYNLGPDTISCFSIAKLTLQGHGALAINTHWAPLFSWLLVPLLALGIAPEAAGALLSLPIGAVVIVATWKLEGLLGLDLKWRRVSLLCTLPHLLYWSMVNRGTDLLSLALMLVFLNIVLRRDFAGNRALSAWAGAVGGVSYLAKSYCFPFFLVSFSLVALWNGIAGNLKRQLGCYLLGVLIFFAISFPWVAAISLKHQQLTIGTAGAFTLQFQAPNLKLTPTEDQGFLAPPNDYAVSYWEDPARLVTRGWSPFRSRSDFTHYLQVVYKNFFEALGVVHYASALAVGLAAMAGMIELSRSREGRLKNLAPALGLIILLMVYTAGYVLIFIEERYLWPVVIAVVLLGSLAIQRIRERSLVTRQALGLFLLLWVGSCFVTPVALLARLVNFGKEPYKISLGLPEIRGSRVASNEYLPGLKLAYYKDAKFYGIPSLEMDSAGVASSLRENRIDYFFLWNEEKAPSYLDEFEQVDEGRFPGMQLYRVRK